MKPACFSHGHRAWPAIQTDVRAWLDANPKAFAGPKRAVDLYFRNIVMPPSQDWALKSVDKAGSTTVLRLLYELEWGTPFSVEMVAPDDINPDSVVHRQRHADLLRPVHQIDGGIAALGDTLRLATVRHPSVRAVSSFLYLCQTQAAKATWLVNDRLRMGAMVGFDWRQHTGTPEGFLRFLDYALAMRDEMGIGEVNTHWRPQWALIRPDLFRPTLLGRCEDLTPFVLAAAQCLECPAPEIPLSNRQPRYDPSPFLSHPGVRERLANLYRADYDSFGYDPDEVPER